MNALHLSIRRVVAACAILLGAVFLSHAAPASAKTDIFNGIVRHVSTDNIKVYDPVSKKTVGFAILPKFNKIFSDKDKTTYQMSAIKPGQYVKVYYDRSFLGLPHADRIYLLSQSNMKLRRE
jgi:hypothetical protein